VAAILDLADRENVPRDVFEFQRLHGWERLRWSSMGLSSQGSVRLSANAPNCCSSTSKPSSPRKFTPSTR
ncbi:MAG: hypothetical protein AAFR04_15290, partial [Pseudomonadota bacterium]